MEEFPCSCDLQNGGPPCFPAIISKETIFVTLFTSLNDDNLINGIFSYKQTVNQPNRFYVKGSGKWLLGPYWIVP